MNPPPTGSGKPITRVISVVLMTLIIVFAMQMLMVSNTPVRISLSIVLVLAMGAAVGWLATALRGGHEPCSKRDQDPA